MTNNVYEWCNECQCMTAQTVDSVYLFYCRCNICGEDNQIKDDYVECPDCEYRCDGVEPYRDSRDDSEDEDHHTKKYECPKCLTLFEVDTWE